MKEASNVKTCASLKPIKHSNIVSVSEILHAKYGTKMSPIKKNKKKITLSLIFQISVNDSLTSTYVYAYLEKKCSE